MLTNKQTVNLINKFTHSRKTIEQHGLDLRDITKIQLDSYGQKWNLTIYFAGTALKDIGIGGTAAFKLKAKLTSEEAWLAAQAIKNYINRDDELDAFTSNDLFEEG